MVQLKYADHDPFLCGSDDYVLCYPNQKIVQFIPGTNKEFTVELYKEEICKPYSKIDLFLCNISNVDDAVDRKVVEDKKYSMERSCIGTSPIFKPSNIIADHSRKTIEERADLCLESKTKFFFEKHTESSDEGGH